MTEQKLGKWEAIILIVAIVINHIILGLPRSIVAEHASASILNVIYISAIVIILIFLICKLLESFPGLNIIDIAEFLGGKVLKIGISILFLLYIIFITGILLRSFSEGLKLIFFPRTSLPIIMILFLIAIVIMNKLNIVSIARANLFFTILVSVSIIFIFIGNWKDLTFQKIFPILGNGAYTTFFSGLSDLFAFGGIACIYLLPPYLKNQRDFKKVAYTSVGLSAFFLLISVATLLFIFPPTIIEQQIFPIYLASRFIDFSRFFQRLDALFLLIWLLSIICYLAIVLYFSTSIFKRVTNLKYSKWISTLFALFIFGTALIPKNMQEISFLENTVYRYIILILVFALSFIILILANIKYLRSQKMKGIVLIILVAILFSFAFTSSHRIQSIDDLTYIVALGIDVGDTERLKVTFQFTKPSAASGEGSSNESSSIIMDTIEAPSIDAALNLINTYSSKEINLSHCKLIIFSEKIAMSGIKEEIFSLANKVQIRPDTNILITTSSARDYIASVKPTLENLITKFYATFPNSSEYTGYIVDANLGQFMNKITSLASQPVALLRQCNF